MTDFTAYDENLPCKNPHCRSYGHPHPNCRCYGLAHGGMVCKGPHKENCEYYASGGQVEENQLHISSPDEALDHVAAQHGLLHLLTKLGHNGRSSNPNKHLEDYIDSFKRGRKSVKDNVDKIFSNDKIDASTDKDAIEGLKKHLQSLDLNPSLALNVGGNLAESLPDHAAALGVKTATAMNYLRGIKPKPIQGGPLDKEVSPSQTDQRTYERQMKIAENPMHVLKHTKEGSLHPQDLMTLHTIYPALGKTFAQRAASGVIDAKEKGQNLTHTQKRGLSTLTGQPLSASFAPQAMQSIIKANASIQQPQSQQKKATSVELKQINKTTDLFATPDQKRQMQQSK